MTDLSAFRETLGLADDITDDQIVAALGELPEPEPEPAPAPTPAPTSSLPEGVVAISQAKLAELETAANAGHAARAQQIRDARSTLVQSAIADGRIAPAEKDSWMAKLGANDRGDVVAETDTAAEQVLAGLKPGLLPVAPIGYAGDETADQKRQSAELAAFNARRFGRPVPQEA